MLRVLRSGKFCLNSPERVPAISSVVIEDAGKRVLEQAECF
jgi:hypothetical protein